MHSQALMVSCSRRVVLPCERASPCAARRGAWGMEQIGGDRSREMMRMRTMGMRSRKRGRRTVSRGAATEKVTSALTNSGSVFAAASSSRDSVIEKNNNQCHATKRIIQCEYKWNMCRNRRVFSISRATSKGFSSTDNVPLSDKV